jgi:phosphoribosylaminoimidazole-succinocarboxamide synthase
MMKKIISGKVRDVYEIDGNRLVIVTTDRISAFDVVLSKPVKNKGKVLNALSLFWFDYTRDIVRNHVISDKRSDMPEFFQKPEFEGRTVLVEKLKMLPFEFVIRGYIFGNMWNAYQDGREFCGLKIEGNYRQAQKLESPILTPSTKANEGHDVYVSFDYTANALGIETVEKISAVCLKLYDACFKRAYENGIIIADTKFEFGLDKDNNLVLADEIFTPDSSRFWSLSDYEVGVSPKSYDKQFIRDWLTGNKINGEIQYDNVPDDTIKKTSEIYQECFKKIAGS